MTVLSIISKPLRLRICVSYFRGRGSCTLAFSSDSLISVIVGEVLQIM